MYAIEFETEICDGLVRIPEQYSRLKNGHAKFVVMVEEPSPEFDIEELFNHSASTIDEWKDPDEDKVWR